MTNETKKLFNAPWTILSDTDSLTFEIRYKVGDSICDNILMFDDANRLARLPELYDALMEAAKEYCESCIRDEHLMGNIPSSDLKIIENGCPFNNTNCTAFKWLDILKKVRDGK